MSPTCYINCLLSQQLGLRLPKESNRYLKVSFRPFHKVHSRRQGEFDEHDIGRTVSPSSTVDYIQVFQLAEYGKKSAVQIGAFY